MNTTLFDDNTFYKALLEKDSSFEGLFFVAVKTTGVFCRPTCTARKPKRENVEFYQSTHEAILNGYRPCKICNPLDYQGTAPDWLKPLLNELDSPSRNSNGKVKDYELKKMGLDPARVRRWFKKHHGMTFQSYLRIMRIGQAFDKIRQGESVAETAFESGYESLSGFNDSFKKNTGFSPGKSENNNIIVITKILSPLGPMIAGATDDGICLLEFVDRRMIETQFKRLRQLFKAELVPGESKYFDNLKIQLEEYFAGKRKEFDIPLAINGTAFQEKAWKCLLTVPYGKTHSYKKQAELIGNPQGVRAVAKANGDNRIAIIIPCHRIIGENGHLTGYGGGLWRKKYLLDLEAKYM